MSSMGANRVRPMSRMLPAEKIRHCAAWIHLAFWRHGNFLGQLELESKEGGTVLLKSVEQHQCLH